MIGKTVGHYRILSKIGEGGMGEVFLSEDTRLERKAAVKFLPAETASDPSLRQRFLREAKAASALNHPHVCTVYDVGETDDGVPFIAMEFVEGQSLDELLKAGPVEVSKVVDIAMQAADALDAAHENRIVHRDIKPANICMSDRGNVKVLDFGLAKRLETESSGDLDMTSEMQQTKAGHAVGTPSFMSPEQALGKEVDHRSDLFSLGSVIYSLLTGRSPFLGSNLGEVLEGVLRRNPEAIARFNYDVPPELERITLKLLTKKVDNRYQSARDLIIDLKSLKQALISGSDTHGGHDGFLRAGEAFDQRTIGASGIDRQTPAPPPSDPKELSHSDVVITYADLDDQPVISGRQGWVSQLQQNLQVRVAQLSGKEVSILKQPDVSASAQIEAQVLEHVPQAKTVVSILSPPFVQASGCHRIVDRFCTRANESSQMEVDHHSRLLKIVKTPIDDQEIPLEVRSHYSELSPYEFFERDPDTGRLREFDEAFGDTAMQRFHERVYDVAYDVAHILKYLGNGASGDGASGGGAPGSQNRTDNPKTVFLAATTSDLQPQRDQLRRELVELGHDVIPKQALPLIASELVNVVQGCLEQSDIAIHFVGEHFGMVPEATELSVVVLQNQVAAQFCGNSDL